jgi:TonB family protein
VRARVSLSSFSLSGAPRLPLTGAAHPLGREFARWLAWANGLALLAGVVLFLAWLLWSRTRAAEPVERRVRIVRYADLGVPPSISTPARPQVKVSQAVAPPSIGVPQPVPDEMAQTPTIATVGEMSEALAPITMDDLGMGGGDSLVIDLEGVGGPAPDEFIQVDEEPVRISMDPPVYPEVARSAEVEGTVLVRALVGKDGRVKDTIILQGQPMLNDAAVASARSAVFRPALQRHRPVEVWVVMPITFRLH